MHYFAYGSNMAPARIEARLGPCPLLGAATLTGYQLAFHKRGGDGSGKCDAYESGGESVMYGAVFELTEEQAANLDRFEGPHYVRRTVSLTAGESSLNAFAYIALPQAIDVELRPYPWYLAFVLHGAVVNALPEAYIEAIRDQPTLPDPDPSRQAANARILAR